MPKHSFLSRLIVSFICFFSYEMDQSGISFSIITVLLLHPWECLAFIVITNLDGGHIWIRLLANTFPKTPA